MSDLSEDEIVERWKNKLLEHINLQGLRIESQTFNTNVVIILTDGFHSGTVALPLRECDPYMEDERFVGNFANMLIQRFAKQKYLI